MPNDNSNPNTMIPASQNKQLALFDAFEEYMGRVSLYSGLAIDYASAEDLAGMAYSMRKAKAYFKAAHDEMAEIVAERRQENKSVQPVRAAPKDDSSQSKEWWEE